ncbi:hypothetical protein PQ472_07815 [Lacticaseibacillus pabuli]|uniref:Uncharacterized protein n=1 Tax=Lacticaseibacillus pabuli TaxID=3025672 RepID=A0ABY7WS93_9LACO|nr:hypothetical protein [Lacticaseibacillus sp. KACC 23028]WDF81831.1 hypothetical protein PQ472_07815 [Lacticaseibacillus sp. KACC 23028]
MKHFTFTLKKTRHESDTQYIDKVANNFSRRGLDYTKAEKVVRETMRHNGYNDNNGISTSIDSSGFGTFTITFDIYSD